MNSLYSPECCGLLLETLWAWWILPRSPVTLIQFHVLSFKSVTIQGLCAALNLAWIAAAEAWTEYIAPEVLKGAMRKDFRVHVVSFPWKFTHPSSCLLAVLKKLFFIYITLITYSVLLFHYEYVQFLWLLPSLHDASVPPAVESLSCNKYLVRSPYRIIHFPFSACLFSFENFLSSSSSMSVANQRDGSLRWRFLAKKQVDTWLEFMNQVSIRVIERNL